MLINRRLLRACYTLVLPLVCALPVHAQTIDDGIMMGRRELQTGNLYSHVSWDQYWEGTLKRRNANIGTITTETNVWTANYGLTNRLNVIGTVPYVWTRASQGVLHGINGFQDLTLAAKWSAIERPAWGGQFRAIAVVSAGLPMTDYNVELLPLSIGLGSTRVSWRGTAHFQSAPGWFVTGSTAFTWQSQVQLDRPYFFTDGEFVMSDRADMPNVMDYLGSGGYMKNGLMAAVSFSLQRTMDGGDIRRQDMPFVSNRMNAFKGGAMLMYPLPKLRPLAVNVGVGHVFDGRNVGQGTSFTIGLLYTFNGRSVE
jgi:hypothetical protein